MHFTSPDRPHSKRPCFIGKRVRGPKTATAAFQAPSRLPGRVEDVVLAPYQAAKLESLLQPRLDDSEKRRDVEIARHVQTVMANMQDFRARLCRAWCFGLDQLDFRQDRIANRAERLREQGRADRLGRFAAAEGE